MKNGPAIDEALEREYNARAARDDYDRILADWNRRSESFRAAAGGALDVPYGPAPRQRLDIFISDPATPTLVYLHGGYWQRGDKSVYSFVAVPFVGEGVNVVVMSYTLCPDTTVPGITGEVREGLAWLYRNSARYGLSAERINVCGHSAGGHLAAMMLTSRWVDLGDDLPRRLVKSAVAISGLYDLAPLRRTSINQATRIDAAAARSCSPLHLTPAAGAPVVAVVGGDETAAFHEQARELEEAWSAAGAQVETRVEPGVDHFEVVNRLADAGSGLFARTLQVIV